MNTTDVKEYVNVTTPPVIRSFSKRSRSPPGAPKQVTTTRERKENKLKPLNLEDDFELQFQIDMKN
jgi:hypothetical protein